MTVSSGIRPYGYIRYPFILQTGELIGISGILLEEPMFVALAERDILMAQSGSDRYFYKYFGENFDRVPIEPNPEGRNLDGTNQNPISAASGIEHASLPACVNFKDYVLDVRTSIETLFSLIASEDSDYPSSAISGAYFGALAYGSGWINNETAIGASGALMDIDLREIQYQPLLRTTKYAPGTFLPSSPIVPMFCSFNGQLPTVTSRDLEHAANIGGVTSSGYQAASNDRLLIAGDVLRSGTGRLWLWELISDKLQNSAAPGECDVDHSRSIVQPLDKGIGEYSFTALSIASGLYSVFVYDADTDVTPSSLLSFWPPRNGLPQTYGPFGFFINDTEEVIRYSGLHVFDTALNTIVSSGIRLSSPHNGFGVWQKFGDFTSWSTAHDGGNWNTPAGYFDDELYYNNVKSVFVSPSVDDEYWVVVKWNADNGDLNGATEDGPFAVVDPVGAATAKVPDVSTHRPASGVSIAAYAILHAREGSDNAIRFGIWDGTQMRGTLRNDDVYISTAAPEIAGVVDGELYGRSSIGAGGFLIDNVQIDELAISQTQPVFPLPNSSGIARAGGIRRRAIRYLVYSTALQETFEQIEDGTFLTDQVPQIFQPYGDFALGDGSALIKFNAKLRGGSVLHSWLGRITPTTSGAEDQLQITEYWGPLQMSPNYVRDF